MMGRTTTAMVYGLGGDDIIEKSFKGPIHQQLRDALQCIRRAKKINPSFDGDCVLEEAICCFSLSQEEKDKCRYTYNDNETYVL